jgi:hypothetical protein
MSETSKVAPKWVTDGAPRIPIEVGVDFGNRWELVYSILHLFRGRHEQACFFIGRTCSGLQGGFDESRRRLSERTRGNLIFPRRNRSLPVVWDNSRMQESEVRAVTYAESGCSCGSSYDEMFAKNLTKSLISLEILCRWNVWQRRWMVSNSWKDSTLDITSKHVMYVAASIRYKFSRSHDFFFFCAKTSSRLARDCFRCD